MPRANGDAALSTVLPTASSPAAFPEHRIAEFRDRLSGHAIYKALGSLDDLRVFMSHHVYSVWDFMSLCKFLQAALAPTTQPWRPVGDAGVRRFINELVMEEESDAAPGEMGGASGFCSHFELYCRAMGEIGADPEPVLAFVAGVGENGIGAALTSKAIPEPSRAFMAATFGFIASGKPHVVAAALTLGREHIIPVMFRAFLADMRVTADVAPVFHFYLNRHVELDADFHAPMSLKLLNECCAGDEARIAEAVAAAEAAIDARLEFWDGVLAALG